MEIKDSVDSAWQTIIRDLFAYGARNAGDSRDGDVSHELVGYSLKIDASNQQTFLMNPARKLSPSYAAAETLWYMSGTDRIDMLEAYAPSYVKFANKDKRAYGAYGKRVMSYLNYAVDILLRDWRSRQAVVSIWRPDDLLMVGRTPDMPCTLTWQFLLRDNKLDMVVNMRSNDVWLGFPYDVFAFTCFQRLVANTLNTRVGIYHHNVGSMHLYARNRDAAGQAIDWKRWKDPDFAAYKLRHDWDSRDTTHNISNAYVSEHILRTNRVHSEGPIIGDGLVAKDEVLRRLNACGSMLNDLVRACNSKLRKDIYLGNFNSGALKHAVSPV